MKCNLLRALCILMGFSSRPHGIWVVVDFGIEIGLVVYAWPQGLSHNGGSMEPRQ